MITNTIAKRKCCCSYCHWFDLIFLSVNLMQPINHADTQRLQYPDYWHMSKLRWLFSSVFVFIKAFPHFFSVCLTVIGVGSHLVSDSVCAHIPLDYVYEQVLSFESIWNRFCVSVIFKVMCIFVFFVDFRGMGCYVNKYVSVGQVKLYFLDRMCCLFMYAYLMCIQASNTWQRIEKKLTILGQFWYMMEHLCFLYHVLSECKWSWFSTTSRFLVLK